MLILNLNFKSLKVGAVITAFFLYHSNNRWSSNQGFKYVIYYMFHTRMKLIYVWPYDAIDCNLEF